MRLAIDTNAYSNPVRGSREHRQIFESADAIFVPVPVLGELRAGFAARKHPYKNELIVDRFLLQLGVQTLPADEATTVEGARGF
ncbi:MAG: PIN domain-containing protein [Opitutales bacterium]